MPIKVICKKILDDWHEDNTSHEKFASPQVFFHHMFQPLLARQVSHDLNKGEPAHAQQIQDLVSFFTLSPRPYSNCGLQYDDAPDSVAEQVFGCATSLADKMPHMASDLHKGQAFRAELAKAENAGNSCRRRAHWVGCLP
jgi:hypothetical protein